MFGDIARAVETIRGASGQGYREGAEVERARSVRFASLSEATQARLLAACRGDGEALLVSWSSLPGGAWLGGAVAAGGALLLGSQLSGFGDLARQPPLLLQGFVVGVGVSMVLAGLLLGLDSRRAPALPAGVFVLPLDLVDTRSDLVRIVPLSMLQQIRAEGSRLRLRFEGGFSCDLPGHGAAAATLGRALQRAQQLVEEASAQGGEDALRRLDPFHDERGRWPTSTPPAPTTWPRFLWSLGLLLVLLAGQVIGWSAAGWLRVRSDERGLAQAERERDDEALRRYIQRGGALSQRADTIRLDIARSSDGDGGLVRYLSSGGLQLARADDELFLRQQRQPTERGLDAYLEVGQRHAAEASSTLIELLERELDAAALQAYAQKRRPQSEHVARVVIPRVQRRLARHELEQAAQRGDAVTLRHIEARRDLPPPGPGESDLRTEASALLTRQRAERLAALRQRLGAASPLARTIEACLAATASSTGPLGVRMAVRHSPDPRVLPSRQGTPPEKAMDSAARHFVNNLVPGFLIALDADSDAPPVPPSIHREPDRRPPGRGGRLVHASPDAISAQLPRPPAAEGMKIELDYDLHFDPTEEVYWLTGRLLIVSKKEQLKLDVRTRCLANRTLDAVATLEAALRDSLSAAPPCR